MAEEIFYRKLLNYYFSNTSNCLEMILEQLIAFFEDQILIIHFLPHFLEILLLIFGFLNKGQELSNFIISHLQHK